MISVGHQSILKILIFLFFSGLSAQDKKSDYFFHPIKSSGSQRAISTITQDAKGFIWIGTNGAGLKKFNGLDYEYYKQRWDNTNTINSSLIYKNYKDASGRLWVGTAAGLNLYDSKQDLFKRIPLLTKPENSNDLPVSAITAEVDGTLFIGTLGFGIFMMDPVSLKSTPVPLKDYEETQEILVNALITDAENRVFAGTNIGLLEYKKDSKQFVPVIFNTDKGEQQISNHIQSMLLADDGALWIGTVRNGLIKISSRENSPDIAYFLFSEKRVLTMIQDSDGTILCGTENDGLFALREDGSLIKNYRYNKFDKNSIMSNSVWSLFLDQQKRIWIGYYNKGIGVYDRFYDKFNNIESLPNIPNSLQSGSVTAIIEDSEKRLWIGMDGGGVDVYDLKRENFVHLLDDGNPIASGLTSQDVQTLFIDSNENIWVGTWNSGIFYLEKNADSFQNYNTLNTSGALASNRILSFSEDSKGTIWFATFLKGLHSFNPITKKFTFHDSDPFQQHGIYYTDIRKVLVDTNDNIWLGTTRGLFKVSQNNGTGYSVASLNDELYEQLGNQNDGYFVISLFEDDQTNIWIGTDGGGLCKHNPRDGSFYWFNTAGGLEQETVSSIIKDNKGDLWFGGNRGLSKLDVATNTFTNYSKNDGLLANDFNNNAVLKNDEGTLYFGNYGGINFFNPDKIPLNNSPPSLYFSELKIFNVTVGPEDKESPLKKVLSETDSLQMNHKQSVFTIEYTGIGYTRPEENQYAYYLEGFEDSWNYVGNTRSATYTNLPKGNYKFKVKAANNDGIWNDKAIVLHIEVLPPWWATTIARASFLVLCLFFFAFLYRIINDRIKEKRLVKFERDKRVQEEALNDRKIQFFTNISHEFRTPLTLIKNPLEDIMNTRDLELPKGITEKHRIIHKNAARLSRLIDELLDFRKLQFDKMSVKVSEVEAVNFVKEVAGYFEEEAAQRNILLSVEADTSPMSIWGDPGMLEKILFNILSNAFKATPDNGAVSIRLSLRNDDIIMPLVDEHAFIPVLLIEIEDTGSGMKQEQIANIFERFFQAKEMNEQYYGGTGIGLEVVNSFVKLHKGTIRVDSKENEGTKFSILLPLGKEHFDDKDLFLSKSETTTGEHLFHIENELDTTKDDTSFKKKTLLIIEDNPELRAYLQGELRSDYVIAEAVNGKQGIDIATKIIPDVIVTDVLMPEMDGYEFCKSLRQDLKTSHIPVLMLTAKAMSEDWVKGIDSGADVYLSKPFEMPVLQSQLKQLINSRQLVFNKYFSAIVATDIPDTASSLDKDFIVKVLKYINENIDDANLNVEHLAEELRLSRSQLYRKIKALTGQTANEFLRNLRLEKAKEMIETTNDSIGEISFKVGFSSPSYFTSCFKTHFGILPTEIKSE